jgi:glutathione S-transferase
VPRALSSRSARLNPIVRLYQFGRVFGLPNASVFCFKVECWLRMAGIEYENVWIGEPSRMPKGKCPVIEHDGRMVADSTFILEYLEQHFSPGLDAHLDAHERAAAHAFARMLEERSYWVMVYSRWMDAAGWRLLKNHFFRPLPPLLREVVARYVHRRVRRQMHGHGIGRHSAHEIYALGATDLGAVSAWLGDRDYFMGTAPCGVDALVYAFVANALFSLPNPLADAARSHTNLAPYCERMRARYFPELAAPPAPPTNQKGT